MASRGGYREVVDRRAMEPGRVGQERAEGRRGGRERACALARARARALACAYVRARERARASTLKRV
eukprot:9652636-Alexandrium_andersonii.AAC.1